MPRTSQIRARRVPDSMHVFIIGSKGIPAQYGGFETFVDKLTAGKQDERIQYHVACRSDHSGEFEHNKARCFNIKTPKIGSAAALWYDIVSLKSCYEYIRSNNLKDCIVYILACRIGPYLSIYKQKLKQNNIRVYLNPDGHEWSRSKWNKLIKMYWKFSERLMIKYSDLVICDSKVIELYINQEYARYKKMTMFIPYGADLHSQTKDSEYKFKAWKLKHEISDSYYLMIGRFVPENNFYTIIREFIGSGLDKDLVIVSNVSGNKFYKELQKMISHASSANIKFVGTVYDQNLLSGIRQNAFAYLHGHEVGGTNPSLLEAMGKTNLNLLYDVVFNREVAEYSALYFTKDEGSLSQLLRKVEALAPARIKELGDMAKKRILELYSWNVIINDYEALFQSNFSDTRLLAVERS